MTQNQDFLVQILEKIGAPLISAVNDVSARLRAANPKEASSEDAGGLEEEAEKIAGLLNKSLQLALSTSELFDIKEDEAQADSLRLSLMSLSGPVLANHYRMTSRLPQDADIKRLKSSLDAVMTFADNFDDAAEAEDRLERADKDFVPSDKTQIHILYLQALVPTINAIAAFPFGQKERKLVQEVTGRLIKKAEFLRQTFVGEVEENTLKKCDLAILRSLSQIYSQCHFSEMARLMSLPAEKREKEPGTMDPVWESFEARAELLEVLGREALPDYTGLEMPEEKAAPAQAPPTQQAAQGVKTESVEQAKESPSESKGEPMESSEKKTVQNAKAQNEEQQPSSSYSSSSSSSDQNPKEKENVDNSDQSGKQDSASTNPMAFFKKPKSSDEGGESQAQ